MEDGIYYTNSPGTYGQMPVHTLIRVDGDTIEGVAVTGHMNIGTIRDFPQDTDHLGLAIVSSRILSNPEEPRGVAVRGTADKAYEFFRTHAQG